MPLTWRIKVSEQCRTGITGCRRCFRCTEWTLLLFKLGKISVSGSIEQHTASSWSQFYGEQCLYTRRLTGEAPCSVCCPQGRNIRLSGSVLRRENTFNASYKFHVTDAWSVQSTRAQVHPSVWIFPAEATPLTIADAATRHVRTESKRSSLPAHGRFAVIPATERRRTRFWRDPEYNQYTDNRGCHDNTSRFSVPCLTHACASNDAVRCATYLLAITRCPAWTLMQSRDIVSRNAHRWRWWRCACA